MFIMIQYKCMCTYISYKIRFPLSVKLSMSFLIRVGTEEDICDLPHIAGPTH